MLKLRPSLLEIHAALTDSLRRGDGSAHDVCRVLACSRSTLYRALADEGTTFRVQREILRVRMAVDALQDGTPVGEVADGLGLSPDHLRVLVVRAVHWGPRQILRARRLATSAWRHGSAAARSELEELCADVAADHLLRPWLDSLLDGDRSHPSERVERSMALAKALEQRIAPPPAPVASLAARRRLLAVRDAEAAAAS